MKMRERRLMGVAAYFTYQDDYFCDEAIFRRDDTVATARASRMPYIDATSCQH